MKANIELRERAKSNQSAARLFLKTQEACDVLGGINPRTLARLEARGLLRSIPLLRHKLYAREDIEALVADMRNWRKQG